MRQPPSYKNRNICNHRETVKDMKRYFAILRGTNIRKHGAMTEPTGGYGWRITGHAHLH